MGIYTIEMEMQYCENAAECRLKKQDRGGNEMTRCPLHELLFVDPRQTDIARALCDLSTDRTNCQSGRLFQSCNATYRRAIPSRRLLPVLLAPLAVRETERQVLLRVWIA